MERERDMKEILVKALTSPESLDISEAERLYEDLSYLFRGIQHPTATEIENILYDVMQEVKEKLASNPEQIRSSSVKKKILRM